MNNYSGSTEYINNDINKSLKNCKKKKAKYIIVNFRGIDLDNIDFLEECSEFIEKLHINSPSVINIDVIYKFKKLKEFSISSANSKIKIDFSRVTNLKYLQSDYYNGFSNIDSLVDLEKINLSKYPLEDLKVFSVMEKLRELILYRPSKLKDLEGLESCECLEVIDIDSAPKLESLKGITSNHVRLRKVRIFNCKSLIEIMALCNAKNLNFLQIGKVPSEVESEAKNLMDNFTSLETVGVRFKPKGELEVSIKNV